MGGKVAATWLHWSQSVLPCSPSSSQKITSAISVISSHQSKRRRGSDRDLICRFIHREHQSSLFGTKSTELLRSRSCDNLKPERQTLRRACSASLNGFSDEEFSEQIKELALRFSLGEEVDINNEPDKSESELSSDYRDEAESSFNGDFSKSNSINNSFIQNLGQFPTSNPKWLEIRPELPDWPERDEIISANIERKANSVDLPFSLRMIKKKKQWQEGFIEAGESAYCSVKKAFSSMVFIIRELHSYTMQMREFLYFEDLQEILVRVQREMHASFVWLFQQVFSHTPTLMVYVMILLANFTVSSVANNTAIAAAPPPFSATIESVTVTENQNLQWPKKFDSSAIKTFSISSSVGNSGGGGKVRPVASGTDNGDSKSSSSNHHRTILPDEFSQVSSFGNPTTTNENELGSEFESETEQMFGEEELKLWNSIVEEASRMQASLRHEALDNDTIQRFVSPVFAEIQPDDYSDYFRTDLLYQTALFQEPKNSLLLSNYAQFLNLVVHDHNRAEEFFKRAISVEPADAEAFDKYAKFLWHTRKDLAAAEETFLEAIEADPGNTYFAANYAHFLWNTGGEDTCFPLNSPDNNEA